MKTNIKALPLIVALLFPIVAGAGTYGQALIHTADGATYIVTTDDAFVSYGTRPNGILAFCITLNKAVGLPPATNDIVFQSGFEPISLCFEEKTL